MNDNEIRFNPPVPYSIIRIVPRNLHISRTFILFRKEFEFWRYYVIWENIWLKINFLNQVKTIEITSFIWTVPRKSFTGMEHVKVRCTTRFTAEVEVTKKRKKKNNDSRISAIRNGVCEISFQRPSCHEYHYPSLIFRTVKNGWPAENIILRLNMKNQLKARFCMLFSILIFMWKHSSHRKV